MYSGGEKIYFVWIVAMLLSGKVLAQERKQRLVQQRKQYFGDREVYVAIIFL